MFTALEQIPAHELAWRHARCRMFLQRFAPEAQGLLVASQLQIYYLTGTLGDGLLWMPCEGEPVLMIRKGLERAGVESPLRHIMPFRSFKEVPTLCNDAQSPLSSVIAVDREGFSWAIADLLQSRLPQTRFVPGDQVLPRARMVKSPWEMNKMRLAGQRQCLCMRDLLPGLIHPGMTERAIGIELLHIFMQHGHTGYTRMSKLGKELFVGFVAAGPSSLYPTNYDGPLGNQGVHPSVPFMGDAGTVWQNNTSLAIDVGFCLEGYHTDATRIYWPAGTPVPDKVRQAQDACIEIQTRTVEALKPGALPSQLWNTAKALAVSKGFADTFMGTGIDQVAFLGHGIGLTVDEYPAMAPRFDEPIETGMTIAMEPKISIPGFGMVGVETTFEITESGAIPLTGSDFDLVMVP